MHKISLILFVLGVGIATADWHMVWEDDFNGGNLKDRWNFEVNCDGGGNNELQCYTDNRPENCAQENGVLKITARRENLGGGKPFTSTRITTSGRQSWLHGKWDMRARLPKGKHLWPALWMMPQNSEYGGWPASGEIDIMEYRGQRPFQVSGALHFGPAWNQHAWVGTGDRDFPFDFSRDFHIFSLDWSPTQIQWLVDGNVYHTESLMRNFWAGFYQQNGQPFDRHFFFIINLAVGGMFFGDEPFDPIEADQWEKPFLEVDYVRKFEWR